MKKIVLFAIGGVALSVGVYHGALLVGASEPVAAVAVAAVAAAAVAVITAVTTITAFAVAAFAVFAATAAVTISVTTTDVAAAVFVAVIITTAVAAAALAAAEEEHVQYQWVLAAYGLEMLAISGALVVGSVPWSIAISLGGIAALLMLWKVAPAQMPAVQAAAPALHPNGA